tara:strand:- start:244 stop:627 length:384 start_codon:yes stop_codon:yes gene_type:complete
MDGTTAVTESFGVTYDLNDNTSIGWDSELGMMMYFDAPAGVTLRLGWSAEVNDPVAGDDDDGLKAETSIGLGYTWWTGGAGLKTSISTNYDYIMAPGADNGEAVVNQFTNAQLENTSNLSVVIGFGF